MPKQNPLPKSIIESRERIQFYPFWMYFGEVIFEPFVLAFFLFILFTRIQCLIETASSASIFWQMVNEDMVNNMFLYYAFLIIIVIWIYFRVLKARRDFKDRKEDLHLHVEMLRLLEDLKMDLKSACKEAVKEALREDREEQQKEKNLYREHFDSVL